MFEFIKNLFKRRGKEFEKFSKILNSYGDILNRIHEEIDMLYGQPVKKHRMFTVKETLEKHEKVLESKTKTNFINALNNFGHQFDNKLKKELDRLLELLTRKVDKTTAYNSALYFYQHHHKAKPEEIKKYVNMLTTLRAQLHIVAVRIDLAILELRDEIGVIHDISLKEGLNEHIVTDIEKQIDKIDENTIQIYELIDRLIQELNLLK